MKTLSAGLQAHVALEVTTLALCWKVTRADAAVYGFTTHDRDLLFSGVTYEALSSFTPSQMQGSASLAVDNLEIAGVLDSQTITADDLRAGRWDFAAIEIFYVNWADLTQGRVQLVRGRLGEVRSGRHSFVAELRGLAQALQQQHGRIVSAACDADLGDARCGVDLGPLTVSGTVTSAGANPRLLFYDNTLSEADGWFDRGRVTFTSGLNADFSAEVKTYALTGGAVELQLPLPYDIAPGDSFEITPGCLKRKTEDCLDKYNNVVNFRGFDEVPGTDRIMGGA